MGLITFAQQQSIKAISVNKENEYANLAIEVERRDLKLLLGTKLYLDLVANQTESHYVELLEGGTFTVNDFEYTQLGIRYILAYFIFAEYITDNRFQDTFAGFVKKNIPESNQANYGELKDKKNNTRLVAFRAWEEVKLFLDNNTSTYEYWNYRTKKKFFTPIITKI